MVHDVQHAPRRRGVDRDTHLRELANRTERVGRDELAHHVHVMRMAVQQHAHVPLRDLGLAARKRALAGVNHERVVRQHVAPSGLRRAKAQVVFFAIARAERLRVEIADLVEQRTAKVEQKPTPVGRSGYTGTAAAANDAFVGPGSAPAGHGLFSQNRGNEHISHCSRTA
jgi:hypothetical protein